MDVASKKKYFIKIFKLAESKYSSSIKRLASDDWDEDWQILIATMLSAQTRDETTIPVAENLFKKYSTIKKLSNAKFVDVLNVISRVNFKYTKAKHVIASAKLLIDNYGSKVPSDIDELITLPGVGRKTANLVISKVHGKDGICVDTHVHAISNLLGFVKSNTPTQTEMQLKEFIPREYWSKINRLFVLWGQDVPRKTKEKLLDKLMEK